MTVGHKFKFFSDNCLVLFLKKAKYLILDFYKSFFLTYGTNWQAFYWGWWTVTDDLIIAYSPLISSKNCHTSYHILCY